MSNIKSQKVTFLILGNQNPYKKINKDEEVVQKEPGKTGQVDLSLNIKEI